MNRESFPGEKVGDFSKVTGSEEETSIGASVSIVLDF
jgi:hypothetical protein